MRTCAPPRPHSQSPLARRSRARTLIAVSTLVVGGAVLPLAGAVLAAPAPAHAGNTCSGACYEGQPPAVVYRVSERPPQEVFTRGFAPQGTDMSLVRHVTGGPYRATSGYIATTSSIESAARIANEIRRDRVDGATVWIYEIRAEDFVHNAEQSLDRIANLARNRAGGSGECEQTRQWEDYAARVEALALAHTLQNEWVAVSPIRPANVRAAWEVARILPVSPDILSPDAAEPLPVTHQDASVYRAGSTRASSRLVGTLPRTPNVQDFAGPSSPRRPM